MLVKLGHEKFTGSPGNNRIQIFTYVPEIYLSSGLNLFGYPGKIDPGYDSYNLLNNLGTQNEIQKIQRYNKTTQRYETALYKGGAAGGDRFDLVSGEGYLVYMKAARYIDFRLR